MYLLMAEILCDICVRYFCNIFVNNMYRIKNRKLYRITKKKVYCRQTIEHSMGNSPYISFKQLVTQGTHEHIITYCSRFMKSFININLVHLTIPFCFCFYSIDFIHLVNDSVSGFFVPIFCTFVPFILLQKRNKGVLLYCLNLQGTISMLKHVNHISMSVYNEDEN